MATYIEEVNKIKVLNIMGLKLHRLVQNITELNELR